MSGRDIHEANRAASPLELLFDLTTVVAVAAAASRLHHELSGGHYWAAGIGLLSSFFSLWWSWVNFTWFSSAYDTNDGSYRVAAMVQMIGMLIMSVGLHQGGTDGQWVNTIGYTVMRISMVALWLRAAREHPESRGGCLRYAAGLAVMQTLWLLRITVFPEAWGDLSSFVFAVMEMLVPQWAERHGRTPWHPHHIAERYSLLTIILLGECMVGAAASIQSVIESQGVSLDLALVGIGTVGLIGTLWWTYFLVPFAQMLHQRRERVALWGYGHAFVFLSLAAFSGVLEAIADVLKVPSEQGAQLAEAAAHHAVSPQAAMMLAAGCVLAFLVTLWWLGGQTTRRQARSFVYLLPSAGAAVLAVLAVWYGLPLPWGLVCLIACPAALIAVATCQRHLHPERFAVR